MAEVMAGLGEGCAKLLFRAWRNTVESRVTAGQGLLRLTYCQLMGKTKNIWTSFAMPVCASVPGAQAETEIKYSCACCAWKLWSSTELACDMLEGWCLCGFMVQKWTLSVLSLSSLLLFSRPRFFGLCRENWITLTTWTLQRWERKYASWDETWRE